MSNPKSVSQWIEGLKQGDDDAAMHLWNRYFQKMVQAAQQKLGRCLCGAADAEDVALSAFGSLCRGAVKGSFSDLKDRYDLWPLLLTITAQKSVDLLRHEARQRRGGGRVLRESELVNGDWKQGIDGILSRGPTGEFLVLMEEQYARLLSRLCDDTLRDIVKWKLEGHANTQISERLGVSIHTVTRKLRMIRLAWLQELRGE